MTSKVGFAIVSLGATIAIACTSLPSTPRSLDQSGGDGDAFSAGSMSGAGGVIGTGGRDAATGSGSGSGSDAGACVPTATNLCGKPCLPGALQCDVNTPQTCDHSGSWVSASACTFVCAGGVCTGLCVPGAKQCANATPQTCSASGQWVSGTVCPYNCTDGACAGMCTSGATQSQACGNCGTQARTCTNGTWGAFGTCTGQGACAAGSTGSQACGNCGTQSRTCSSQCTWGAFSACSAQGTCAAGDTSSQACGNCGTQSRTCSGQCAWGAFGACTGQGTCAPTTTSACSSAQICGQGTETCSSSCTWGACSGNLPRAQATAGSPPVISFADSTVEDTFVGSVPSPPAFAGTSWTLSFTTSQNGNVDNTHTSAAGAAGQVSCSSGSGGIALGSQDFSSRSFQITCPAGAAVYFYKEINWGGGCCGGYTRNYNIGIVSYTGC